ncbi:hypothetical protein [Okibacterium fritillariae]|uniref:Uncharacterized protein n=1 Tax=Okibacterium fritillariae TaxID=123320 RepID=A0A1T5JAQ7_9MICO|nr:hypothetical protein [Okibacterium fritillariae]SKC48495.1 hypothetical protein SAMN06309945_1385 [Okibacterium fritillariae]
MSSNTDEPQLTRRQMRERRGVDTQGVPIVGAADGSADSGDAAKSVPAAAPATRSRRVSTSAAVAGGQIPDVQAAERAAADASTDAEKAEAARQTAPTLSVEEIAELEKRAQAGIPLTRRQARDLEKAKTASVPVISAADAAAHRAATAAAAAGETPSTSGADTSDADQRDESTSNADAGNAATSDAAVNDAATSDAAESQVAQNAATQTGAGKNAADATADDTSNAEVDVAEEPTPTKSSKRSKRAEKKAAQEAKRAEDAAREAAAAQAVPDVAAEDASAAAPVAPIRPAFIGKPAAAAPLIESLDSTADAGEQATGRPGPRRSSYTPVGADGNAATSTSETTDAEIVDAEAESPSQASGASANRPETIVVPEVVDSSDTDESTKNDDSSAAETADAEAAADADADADAEAPKLAEGFGEQVLDSGSAASTAVPHDQPFDRIIARGVEAAEAQAASNALILPTMPSNDSLTGPISSNGNVIVTGSIDLPASLSSTGQHPNYFDKAELDTMFEADEDAAPATAGTPVSAARAVSTHTQTGDVINPPAPSRDHRLLIILAITAGALLTAVLAVVIVGFVVGAF